MRTHRIYGAMLSLIPLISFFFVPTPSAAQGVEDLQEMSLEQLLDVPLLPGSVLRQPIENAPVVIDIITEEQIEDFDADNLYELISFLPGIEMVETFFGRTVLQFRGVMNIHYTNKILLMINESPMFEPVNGAFFLELIPVNAIRQIEIIRGRGGTLYGTNAYSGVINITTKKGRDENPLLAVKAGYGSYHTADVRVSSGYEVGNDSGFYIGAQTFNGNGYDFNVTEDEAGARGTLDYINNSSKFYANYQSARLSLDIGYMRHEKTTYGIVPNLNYTGLHERDMFFANGKYAHPLSDTVRASLAVRYNHFDQAKGNIGYFPFPGFGGHDPSQVDMQLGGSNFNTELQVEAILSSKWSNISGFIYESAKSKEYRFVWQDDKSLHPFSAYSMRPESSTVSGYSQFQFKPKDSIQTVAGIRVVRNSDVNDIFLSPRLGVIYSFNDNYYFKVLYGKAFRIPNFFEKYVSTYNVLYGSVDLEPESLQSFDVALEGHFDRFKAKLNGFFASTDQGISRVPTDSPDEHGSKAAMYINTASYNIYGFEASLSTAINNDSYLGANIGWKDGKDDQSGEKLMYFAKVTSNAWLNYDFNRSLSITPMIQYVGKRDGISAKDGHYEIEPYVLLSLSASYNFDSFSIIATGKNLLNSDYVYPEFVRRNVREIPGGPGRSFRVSVRFEM